MVNRNADHCPVIIKPINHINNRLSTGRVHTYIYIYAVFPAHLPRVELRLALSSSFQNLGGNSPGQRNGQTTTELSISLLREDEWAVSVKA